MERKQNKLCGITTKDKVGYALGDVGCCLVFGLVNTFLQVFYTDKLGIAPIIVMLIMIFARIWDAVNDTICGRIVDRAGCKKPGTKYKRWLLYFAIPIGISAVLMFIDVKKLGLSNGGVIAFAACTYVLFGMLYTCANVPYGSLASVITIDDKERNSLSIFRSVGSTLGGFGALILSFICYDKIQSGGTTKSVLNSNKLIIGAVILAILCAIALFGCYLISKERVIVDRSSKEYKNSNTMTILKKLIKTKSFVVISIVGMLFLAAQMFQTTYNSYVFTKFFKNGGFAAITQVCQYVPIAIIMCFSGKLVKKFGRKEICALGMLFSAISFAILAVIPTSINKTTLMILFFIFSLLVGFGNSFILLMIWALANDSIDDYFVKSKTHDEATAYSIFTFMRKLGQTLAAVIVNVSLIAIGYGKGGSTDFQPTEGQALGMYYQSIIIPAALFLIIFILLTFVYPLSKKRVEELQVEKHKILDK